MAKLNKTYNILIRLSIFVLTFYYLYDQLFNKHNLPSFWEHFSVLTEERSFRLLFLVVLFLLPVNLLLESYKWKLLIDKLEQVTHWNALKAVLAGISVSMFMPNRTGDFLGRVFILKKANRIQASLITVLGSLAQLLTTILFGVIALVILNHNLLIQYHLMNWLFYAGIIVTALILIALLVLAYINFSAFSLIIQKISGRLYSKIKQYVEIFAWYDSDILWKVLLLSILRYLVFSFQFFILMKMFEIKINYPQAMVVISLIYLVMSVIPTIALSELGVRGSVSLYVFDIFFGISTLPGYTAEKIVAASSALWFLNLAIPAISGIFFIFKLKFFRNKNDI